MRKIIFLLTAAALVGSTPGWARESHYSYRPLHIYRHGSYAEARDLILSRNLLTPEQLACSELVRGDRASGQVTEIRVLRRADKPMCPVEANLPPLRFDLFIDNASGSYQWTREGVDELQELPYLGDVRRQDAR